MILDIAGRPAQKTGFKLDHHERFLGYFVFAAYAKARRMRKSKTGVVVRMTQHNDGTEAELLALFKACAHKRRPDAFELVLWGNGHGCKAHDLECGMARERNMRKHDVPRDCIVVLCDDGDDRLCLFAQSVHQIGFGWRFEGGCVHRMDSSPVWLFFGSNQHVLSHNV